MAQDVFEKLDRLGVGFIINVGGGDRFLGLDDVRRLAAGEYTADEVQAHLEGVTLETYRRWQLWSEARYPRCRAITQKGTVCKRGIFSHLTAAEFETEAYCTAHLEIMNRYERDQRKKEYEEESSRGQNHEGLGEGSESLG